MSKKILSKYMKGYTRKVFANLVISKMVINYHGEKVNEIFEIQTIKQYRKGVC